MTATEQVRDTLIRDCDDATIAEVCAIIDAELDAKDAEIARLTAEVAALRPAAKGWETLRALYEGQGSSIEYAYSMACDARAREASK